MNTTTFKYSFKFSGLLFLSFLIVSCSNDDDSPTTEPTVEELLTSGTGSWYAESQTDFTMNDCYKHGYYRFLANGNFIAEIYSDDSGSCEIINAFSGTWELLTDTEITLTLETTTTTFTIVTISENELVLNSTDGSSSTTTIFDKTPGNG